MHSDQLPYRTLHDDVLRYSGDALFDDLIRPWLAQVEEEQRWLEDLEARLAPASPMSQEENWRLYALARVVDLLALGLAPSRAGEAKPWNVATLSLPEFQQVFESLGLSLIHEAGEFDPLIHEIVTVDQALESGQAPQVSQIYWPGLRLGSLILARAGTVVVAGGAHIAMEIAESSTLYWAYARQNRPTSDLGDGWGHNSQWRTSLRLDYDCDGTSYLNVPLAGARRDPEEIEPDLLDDERLELLTHRCFVRCRKPHDDRWPYEWSARRRPNEPFQLTANVGGG